MSAFSPVSSKEKGAHLIPQAAHGMVFVQGLLKEGTTTLLELIDPEGQHGQHRKDAGQILFSVAVVMFEMVALVFERVEGFVFDFPACPASFHNSIDGIGGEGLIGNPGEVLLFLRADLPLFQEMDAEIGMTLVERQVVDPAEAMGDACVIGIDDFQCMAAPALMALCASLKRAW